MYNISNHSLVSVSNFVRDCDPKKTPKICLNMIVKNESKIITRLFDSVLPLIDTYCICDTGSTDNTMELIREYFGSREIPGKIIQIPFQDFAFNRTKALNACADTEDIDYLLLMDADMILRIPDKTPEAIATIKSKLTQNDAYYIFQGSDRFFYKNVRIIKNGHSKEYRSVTHEYIETPPGTRYGVFDRSELFIEDIGDGGSKSDKFERDIRLLLGGLEKEPKNPRYHFYLASSYRDAGKYETAIEYYKKRVELGGWFEEIWYSFYAIGNCYERIGNMSEATYYWMQAYNIIPNRLENLYKIIKHYRESGKNELAYMYYRLADTKRKTLPSKMDFLFLDNDVYNYKLDYEMSIIGYYCNYDSYDLTKICMKLIANPSIDNWMYKNIASNYKFYCPKLSKFSIAQFDFPITNVEDTFVSSTPSIVLHKGGLYVNVRIVNYFIDDRGNYVQRDKITTENRLYEFSSIRNFLDTFAPAVPAVPTAPTWNPYIYTKIATNDAANLPEIYQTRDATKTSSNIYIGTEDIRLFSHLGSLLYNGNRGLGYHSIVVEHGDVYKETSKILTLENQSEIEKNWTLFENSRGELRYVYHWWPLQIGVLSPDDSCQLVIQHRLETPSFFKHLRGSTNGVRVHNEIWFICHLVSYEDRRYYYHIFVALDPTTYEVLRYSRLFSFEGEKVEYTLGFAFEKASDRLIIGYSTMDRNTKFMVVSKSIIESAIY